MTEGTDSSASEAQLSGEHGRGNRVVAGNGHLRRWSREHSAYWKATKHTGAARMGNGGGKGHSIGIYCTFEHGVLVDEIR